MNWDQDTIKRRHEMVRALDKRIEELMRQYADDPRAGAQMIRSASLDAIETMYLEIINALEKEANEMRNELLGDDL